jgi:hypothetical protein
MLVLLASYFEVDTKGLPRLPHNRVSQRDFCLKAMKSIHVSEFMLLMM